MRLQYHADVVHGLQTCSESVEEEDGLQGGSGLNKKMHCRAEAVSVTHRKH